MDDIGIQKIYIGQYNGSSLTYTYDADMTIGTFSGATVSFYTYEQENESADNLIISYDDFKKLKELKEQNRIDLKIEKLLENE